VPVMLKARRWMHSLTPDQRSIRMRKSVMPIPIAILSSWTLSASDINLDRWYIANWRGSPPATLGAERIHVKLQ
jgi:hypothetical protein